MNMTKYISAFYFNDLALYLLSHFECVQCHVDPGSYTCLRDSIQLETVLCL